MHTVTKVHIDAIAAGDTVEHNGIVSTVGQDAIKRGIQRYHVMG